MSTPEPTTSSRGGFQPKTDRRTLITFAIAVPALIIFATGLLGMNFLMALILGAIIGLRILFPDDRRVLVAVIVLAIGWAILLPFLHDEGGDFMNIATLILAYSVMALGLNIIVGYAGLLDLGYVAFFALGALTAGWFMSDFYANAGKGGNGIHVLVADVTQNLFGIHFNFLMVVVVAVVVTTIAGMLIGLPTLRLRGDYIAIVTLAFGEIVGRIVINGDQIHYKDVPLLGDTLTDVFGKGAVFSGGREGIGPIDKIWLFVGEPFKALDLRPWYLVALAMVLLVLFVNYRLRDSRLGRAWIALREDEVAAASMGVPLVKTKLLAYGTGAAFGGMAGVFLASRLSVVNADQFQFFFSIFILAMVILGGLGSVWGVVLGAVALAFVNNRLIPDVLDQGVVGDKLRDLGLNFSFTEISFGVFGFILVIMMVLRPEGILPERRRQMELTEGIGESEAVFEARA